MGLVLLTRCDRKPYIRLKALVPKVLHQVTEVGLAALAIEINFHLR